MRTVPLLLAGDRLPRSRWDCPRCHDARPCAARSPCASWSAWCSWAAVPARNPGRPATGPITAGMRRARSTRRSTGSRPTTSARCASSGAARRWTTPFGAPIRSSSSPTTTRATPLEAGGLLYASTDSGLRGLQSTRPAARCGRRRSPPMIWPAPAPAATWPTGSGPAAPACSTCAAAPCTPSTRAPATWSKASATAARSTCSPGSATRRPASAGRRPGRWWSAMW